MEIKLYIKTKPASWDGYQRLAFALIVTTLQVIKDLEDYYDHMEHDVKKESNLISYADSCHFIYSPMFNYLCDFCAIDYDNIKNKVNDIIDQRLLSLGNILILHLETETVTLKLKNDIKITIPKRLIKAKKVLKYW